MPVKRSKSENSKHIFFWASSEAKRTTVREISLWRESTHSFLDFLHVLLNLFYAAQRTSHDLYSATILFFMCRTTTSHFLLKETFKRNHGAAPPHGLFPKTKKSRLPLGKRDLGVRRPTSGPYLSGPDSCLPHRRHSYHG